MKLARALLTLAVALSSAAAVANAFLLRPSSQVVHRLSPGAAAPGIKANRNVVRMQQQPGEGGGEKPFYRYTAKDIDGNDVDMAQFRGKPVMVVNVASRCGFTKANYNDMSGMKSLVDEGFEILAFPCSQFGNQEPLPNDQIKVWVQNKYPTFPGRLMSKIDVNGKNAHPLFEYLKDNLPSGSASPFNPLLSFVTGKGPNDIQWNFEKFLIDRNGNLISRHPSCAYFRKDRQKCIVSVRTYRPKTTQTTATSLSLSLHGQSRPPTTSFLTSDASSPSHHHHRHHSNNRETVL